MPVIGVPIGQNMWTPGRRRTSRAAGAHLFIAYAALSLLPVTVLGAVLVRADQDSGVSRAIHQGRAQAAVIEQTAIAPRLDGEDFDQGLLGSEVANLYRAADVAIFSGSVSGIRLRSFAGKVILHDDSGKVPTLASTDRQFRRAVGGQVQAALITASGERMIRVLQPVVPPVTGRPVGILELYLPYAPVAEVVANEQRQTYKQLGVGLLALYVVLAVISWSASRRLRRYAAKQAHDAAHDHLTGLANRAFFRDCAESAVKAASAGADDDGGALVLIDLNRFKEVNDTLGHHAGDDLLRCVAERLTDAVRTDDLVARLGGDEFGLILPHTTARDHVLRLLESVHDALAVDVQVAGATLSIEASFGVVFFPEHGTELSQLMIHADAAMYQAKRGINRTVIWAPGASAPTTRWHETQAELQRALDEDQVVLHYQPKVDLRSGRLHSVEALARWNHPTRGLLLPAEFVPAAEASLLIGPFTDWALRRALTDQQAWKAQGLSWGVAVNVSAHNLEQPGFADRVLALLEETGTQPQQLTIELTETALAYDSDIATRTVVALAAAGITVSVDDFGTGSTGLLQLRGLAVQEIKIDRVFVADLAADAGDRNVARAVVELAHGMGATVVGEGVEDAAAADYLTSIGCDYAQGFLYQKPVPWPELARAHRLRPDADFRTAGAFRAGGDDGPQTAPTVFASVQHHLLPSLSSR